MSEVKQNTQVQEEQKQVERIRYARPNYRIQESESAFVAEVDVPGVARAAVEITLEDGVLDVTGSRPTFAGEGWKRVGGVDAEFAYKLRLAVGDEVDGQAIAARVEAGVLRLELPKSEKIKPRRIAIN